MTLLEIRKWQIEQALAVDAKWTATVRQSAERISLTSAALIFAVIMYREDIGIYASDTRYIPMMTAIGGAIFFSGLLYFCAADAQNESTIRIAPRIEKLGQEDNVMIAPWTSTLLQRWMYRSLVALAVISLVGGFALAGSMLIWPGPA